MPLTDKPLINFKALSFTCNLKPVQKFEALTAYRLKVKQLYQPRTVQTHTDAKKNKQFNPPNIAF